MWQRLVAEQGAQLSESTVTRYVRHRRVELGLDRVEVMVPQRHEPGAEAEVDFGEFLAVIDGEPTKCWMFVMRLSASGRAFHSAYGHAGAGGVPGGSCPGVHPFRWGSGAGALRQSDRRGGPGLQGPRP